ncbi:MAG: twin-arginine translocation signal domain-containing protein [Candidatus Hydrogenedentes bacterium]|nr:twin-arginine translocation signal domain-containing protein [Candidatus Hydrogenedentota bacterium]
MNTAQKQEAGVTRRTFVKGVAATPALAAAASGQEPAASAKKEITHIIAFIHPPVTYSYRQLLRPAPEIWERLYDVLARRGAEKSTAVVIFQSSRGDKPLVKTAREHFGDRCFVDPNDGSEATLAALAHDQNRAFSGRGNHGEWNIYEIWSSNNARRWTEGFRQDLAKRGYAYTPEALTMETFGSWSGCHHKYSNFFPTYLGMTKPAYIHGEMQYCTLKGMPMDVGEFVGEHVLDRGVVLTLFRRTDGCPMAQFWDGLRPVWDRPHMATVRIAPGSVELFNFSPNSFIKPAGEARKLSDGFIADVGDGCRPEYTTVIGDSPKDADFETFCEAMKDAVIEPIPGPAQVFYMVEV